MLQLERKEHQFVAILSSGWRWIHSDLFNQVLGDQSFVFITEFSFTPIRPSHLEFK